ncbi:MAG: hypothetical protein KDK45_20940, partial [Leptospiraceae bacterium]|nr:hypothetical protein [Leptospiraceae bacterium]
MRTINMFKKFSFWGSLILILVLAFTSGCSKKKQAIPLLPLALTGSESVSSGGIDDGAKDSNGITLPSSNSSTDSGTSSGTGTGTTTNNDGNTQTNTVPSSKQEVATHGPAKITGKIVPTIGGLPICAEGQTPGDPPQCVLETGAQLDLTKVEVKLIQNVNGEEVVVATTNLNADGSYTFNVEDLNNGVYRVLTNSGNGLNFVEQDFQFTYDPTSQNPT